MPANLLHALTDENPDLKKQFGCMTGIFQLFDRHHVKRINSHAHKRLSSPGHSHLNDSSLGPEQIQLSPQTAMEKNWIKNVNDNHRSSVESSGASFSSSSCSSSFSSLDCSKTAQSDPPSSERTALLEKSPKNPPKPNNPDIDSRPNYASCQDQPNTCSPSRRESVDLRDVVKDSIYRETRMLSVKTMTREEPINHVLKHRDSPRLLQLPKSVDASYAIGINGKPKLPSNLHESLRVLEKLKEAPWNLSEVRKSPRSSSETKYSSSFELSKDAPRLSYDGREIPRRSFDSKDAGRSTMKLKEPPRFSLDSRAGSMRSSNFDSKLGKSNLFLALNPKQELEANKRPPGVVAKLMGLDVMPNSRIAAHAQTGWTKASSVDDDICNGERNTDLSSKRSKEAEEAKQNRGSQSPKNSFKDPVSPRRRNLDSVKKPISSSRFPIETAPWRQPDHVHRQKTSLSNRDTHPRPQTSLSVYSEIKRMKELEFQQPEKDLRPLKHELVEMHAKGSLKKKTEDEASCFHNCNNLKPIQLDQNSRLADKHNMRSSRLVSSPIKASRNTASSFESPIVIMKPAKFIDNLSIPASSVIPLNELSGLRKLHIGVAVDSKSVSANIRMVKGPTSKFSLKEPIPPNFGTIAKRTNGKTVNNNLQKPRPRCALISSRPHPLARGNTGGSSTKNSGSLSPRLQQKKVELDKQSHPSNPSADLSKPRRKPLRQQSESGSPGGRHRPKPAYSRQNDDQSSDITSETMVFSHHDDEISAGSDSNISLASQVDFEVTSANRSGERDFQPSNQSPSQRAASNMISRIKQKKSLQSFDEDGLSMELTIVSTEQPSPVSVLDTSLYKDDLLPSPVKTMESCFIDDDSRNSDAISGEEGCNPIDLDCTSFSRRPDFSSGMVHKKLEKIECLVQKLRRLNSSHDEISKDHIASLCENTDPDHRYISEILLASGLLLKDFSSGIPQIHLHSSGQLINPDLFLVLEQTKISSLSKTEPACKSILLSKANKDKLKRKLVFDAVNEILIRKLALTDPQREPWLLPSKLAGSIPSGQRLLKELCSEFDQLNPDNLERNMDVNDGGYCQEVSGLVLDVERLIFKDLVDEIVSAKSLSLRAKQSRQRRQLFA